MFIGLLMTGIAVGLTAVVALWSYNPFVAILLAPVIASSVAGVGAVGLVTVRRMAQAAVPRHQGLPVGISQQG